jgi:hypothetical protein
MPLKVLHERAFGALPLLDGARAARGKRELGRVGGQRAHALLVVGQDPHRLARRQVPHAHRRVQATCDDLRVGLLADEVRHGARVPREHVHVAARAHVPHAGSAVTPTCDEHVDGGV